MNNPQDSEEIIEHMADSMNFSMKAQSEAVRRWKLWESSTGPRTPDGKARSAARSLKHGRRSAIVHLAGAVTACISKLARELDE